jgi:hypothetical protein
MESQMPTSEEDAPQRDQHAESQSPGPREDRGRAPESLDGKGGLVMRDEDHVRASFGLGGSPAEGGEANPRMRGGFGGDGYNSYGQIYGPGADAPGAVPLEDADRFGPPDEAAEDRVDGDDAAGSTGE